MGLIEHMYGPPKVNSSNATAAIAEGLRQESFQNGQRVTRDIGRYLRGKPMEDQPAAAGAASAAPAPGGQNGDESAEN